MNERYDGYRRSQINKKGCTWNVGRVLCDRVQNSIDQDKKTKKTIFETNEIIAKNFIDTLPPDFIYHINRKDIKTQKRNDYQVKIINKHNNDVDIASTEDNFTDSLPYAAFGLETELLIREPDGQLMINENKLDELYQNLDKLDQTGQIFISK